LEFSIVSPKNSSFTGSTRATGGPLVVLPTAANSGWWIATETDVPARAITA
jgi:hypothetical protein